MSQESSADVVQEALALGALGYVVKTDAGSELLPAVDAVLRGRGSLSVADSRVMISPTASDARVSEGDPNAVGRPRSSERRRSLAATRLNSILMMQHFVVGFTRFIEAALQAGNAVIVVATESHRKSLLQRLQEHGVDTAAAIEQGRYISLDVADTLSTFMVNDLPDPVRFLKIAGDLVMDSRQSGERGASACCSLW